MPERARQWFGRRSRLLPALVAACLAACGGADIPEVPTDTMEPAVGAAIRAALEAVAEDRRNPGRWGRLGMTLHAHRLPGPAARAYAEAARLDSDDHRWPHLHARLVEFGDPERALALAGEALRRNPRFPPALAVRARAHEALGEHLAARAAWEALQGAAPQSVEAALALGRRRLAAGDAAGARATLERLVESVPGSTAGWSFLSQTLSRLGDPEGARAAALRAQAAARTPSFGNDSDPDPLLQLVEDLRADRRGREARARRAAGRGDHDTAEAIYRQLAGEQPESAELHYNHANSLARLGRNRDAEAAYRAALTRDPDSSATMANLANLLARSGRNAEADELYERSIAADRTHLPTLLGASSLRFQRGDLRAAERLLREALALEPAHPAALQGLGQLLATTGRLGEAAATLEEALSTAEAGEAEAGQRAGLHFLLADVERQRGRVAEALRHLSRAEELGMEVPTAFRLQLEGALAR